MASSKNMYVVGYLCLHDGELRQLVVYATSEVEACNIYLEVSLETMEQIYDYCSNCDTYINVLEL